MERVSKGARENPRRDLLQVGPLAWSLLALGFLVLVSLAGCDSKAAPGRQLDRGTIHVSIAETLDGVPTDLNIAQLLITRALLQHGFELAPKDEARFRVEGGLTCTFHQELMMHLGEVSQLLENQWNAEFTVTLTDRGPELSGPGDTESFTFPEPMMNGRTDPELARRDIRRRAATKMIEHLVTGRMFSDPAVAQLLNALQDPYDPRLFNEIEAEIIALGPHAVPHLLIALTDKRPVRPLGEYPGLESAEPDDLKVYHLADRMLSEILGRYPGLDIVSTDDRRMQVITGWTWAWEEAQAIPLEYRVRPGDREGSVRDIPR